MKLPTLALLIVGLLIVGLLTLNLVVVLIEIPMCTVTRADLNGNEFKFRVPCEWQKPHREPEPVLPSSWRHI